MAVKEQAFEGVSVYQYRFPDPEPQAGIYLTRP